MYYHTHTQQPEKFFKDDMWPQVEEQLEKLDIDFSKALAIFKSFVNMDVDASSNIDIEECFQYFGGSRTPFTERFFWVMSDEQDPHQPPKSLSYLEFTINAYRYLSLSASQLAIMIYDIYDVDKNGFIGVNDIESMYKYLYNCDTYDDNVVRKFTYNGDGDIAKMDFIEHINKNDRRLIQPAIDYQRRIRKRLGGLHMWEKIAAYRVKTFHVFDRDSESLEEALTAILMSDDPHRRRRKQEAARLLEETKQKLQENLDAAERQLKEREYQVELERKQKEAAAPDRHLKKALAEFEKKRDIFKDKLYTVNEIMDRRNDRLELYTYLDVAMNEANAFYEINEEKEIRLTVGTDADHRARYKDYLKTTDGKLAYKRTVITIFYENVLKEIEMNRKKRTIRFGVRKKSEKEVMALTVLDDVDKNMKKLEQIKAGDLELKRRYVPKTWIEETKTAKKLAVKGEFEAAEAAADDRICKELQDSTISGMYNSLEGKRSARKREWVMKEFEVATAFGARGTVYEYLWDKKNDKMVYVDVNTLQILHSKTAICEMCDYIYDQSDIKCKSCDNNRSAKNLRLYRPLGFKDIRVD